MVAWFDDPLLPPDGVELPLLPDDELLEPDELEVADELDPLEPSEPPSFEHATAEPSSSASSSTNGRRRS